MEYNQISGLKCTMKNVFHLSDNKRFEQTEVRQKFPEKAQEHQNKSKICLSWAISVR